MSKISTNIKSALLSVLIFDKFTFGQLAASRFSSLSGRLAASPRQGFLPSASGRGFFLPQNFFGRWWGVSGYTCLMLWIKALHIVFIASWFAGLFYLPRIFVNLAMVPEGSDAERDRLLLMARKLMRFTTLLSVPAVALGVWLWWGVGIGWGPGNAWMHAKLALVLLIVGYHHACGRKHGGNPQ